MATSSCPAVRLMPQALASLAWQSKKIFQKRLMSRVRWSWAAQPGIFHRLLGKKSLLLGTSRSKQLPVFNKSARLLAVTLHV